MRRKMYCPKSVVKPYAGIYVGRIYMEGLTGRLDVLLVSPESRIELLSSQEYGGIRKSDSPVMG